MRDGLEKNRNTRGSKIGVWGGRDELGMNEGRIRKEQKYKGK